MSVMGTTTLLIASAAPDTSAPLLWSPLREIQEQQEIKDTCAKVLPASYTAATQIANPQSVASYLQVQTWYFPLYWKAVLAGYSTENSV